jgi:hypothetical protein
MVAMTMFRDRFEHRSMKISCDSQSTFMVKNPAYHSKTNHIYVQYHFMTDMVKNNKVLLDKVDMLENIVDSLTKTVSIVNFSWFREEMGIASLGM